LNILLMPVVYYKTALSDKLLGGAFQPGMGLDNLDPLTLYF